MFGMDDKTDDFEKLAGLVRELLTMLESVEDSELTGREFHPTTISSCRCMHTQRLSEILPAMKKLVMPVSVASQIMQDKDLPRTLINKPLRELLQRGPSLHCPKCDAEVLSTAFDNGWAICSVCSTEIESKMKKPLEIEVGVTYRMPRQSGGYFVWKVTANCRGALNQEDIVEMQSLSVNANGVIRIPRSMLAVVEGLEAV